MANDSIVEKLASGLGQSATVRNVFGDPIQSGEKTIIPVARIAYGFGGGYGHGPQKHKNQQQATETQPDGEPIGEGAGGGGGLYARPKGVYEITASGTRFIPAIAAGQIMVGIAIGFLLKAIFFSKGK